MHRRESDIFLSSASNPRPINRRKLLKAMAVGGGTVALSTMLPAKWVKPIVEIGVLPAHAQCSEVAYGSTQYTSSASPHSFTVPACVTILRVTARGGAGGVGAYPGGAGGTGGQGGVLVADISVTPGQVYTILVGQKGSDAVYGSGQGGGDGGTSGGVWPGGDGSGTYDGGGGGGGGSYVLLGQNPSYTVSEIVAAAGGGGGGGSYNGYDGGAGGADTGANSVDGGSGSLGGSGGDQTGSSGSGTQSGSDGEHGEVDSGGGGAGYYGGSGGINIGGGGGSNHPVAANAISSTRGGNTGDGSVLLEWGV